jgi:membrane protein implicated in regulation of membrane protease activity
MRRALAAVVDFIAGDDVWVAVGVGAAVVLTVVLAHLPVDPWWLLPLAVPAIVAVSLLRATRRQRPS